MIGSPFLTQEMPGILNWAIQGCLLWQADGLPAPASLTASVSEYRSEMDAICSFIANECIFAAHERIPIGTSPNNMLLGGDHFGLGRCLLCVKDGNADRQSFHHADLRTRKTQDIRQCGAVGRGKEYLVRIGLKVAACASDFVLMEILIFRL